VGHGPEHKVWGPYDAGVKIHNSTLYKSATKPTLTSFFYVCKYVDLLSCCWSNNQVTSGWLHATQGPKFKTLLAWSCPPSHRIYVPRFIDTGPAVSKPYKLKMLTAHRRTFDRLYKSSRKRRLTNGQTNRRPSPSSLLCF